MQPSESTMLKVSADRVMAGYERVKNRLLAERVPAGHWVGELSTSALSTATAIMALEQVRRTSTNRATTGSAPTQRDRPTNQFDGLIERGLQWLVEHQNADGGWGDTTASFSNISTTMLCHAVFHATSRVDQFAKTVAHAKAYVDRAGGVPALRRRYGRDQTFSIPILTHCALAGLIPWREVSALPFEMACVPQQFYKWIRLPVVSYALPALIAIGQCRAYHRPSWNPLLRALRRAAVAPSLRLLEQIQPTSGGFLEATPLTSFVTMSLASIRQADHPVVQRGVQFILDSVRPDGSWPIDTNLATWVSTLSINALGPDLPSASIAPLQEFLYRQQYRTVHPYTQADPGGWAWTDLSGGVPDADDTPGALLAIKNLTAECVGSPADTHSNVLRPQRAELAVENPAALSARILRTNPTDNVGGSVGSDNAGSVSAGSYDWQSSVDSGIRWLLDLQNRDGGWPTFCRGWGALPFDRSAPDLTAHALRAIEAHYPSHPNRSEGAETIRAGNRDWQGRLARSREMGFRYLTRTQRADGSWLPLWFGNQHHPADENATYGTARVLAAYRDTSRISSREYQRGLLWLIQNQNEDGSWSGSKGLPPSIEETSLALDIVLSANIDSQAAQRGLEWLVTEIEADRVHQQSPIGFYFAKLWYSERLYPLCFATQAMRRAVAMMGSEANKSYAT